MKDLKLIDGDIAIWKNDLELVHDKPEVAQSLGMALGTNEGEFVLEPEMGIKFFNILGKGVTIDDIKAEVLSGLTQDERVETVDEIEATIDSTARKSTVHFRVTTVENETIESEAVFDAQ